MGMPKDVGVVDTMVGLPPPRHEGGLPVHHPADQGHRVQGAVRLPGGVHVQGRHRQGGGGVRGPGRGDPPGDGPVGDRAGPDRRGRSGRHRRPGPPAPPGPVHPLLLGRPQRRDAGHRAAGPGVRDLRRSGGRRLPGRHLPPGAHQRQEDVPALRQVRGAGHPHLLLRRHPRAPPEGGLPARGAHRRGHVRLPRPDLRDPARLRAVDRAGREADAQVAGPALLDQCLRPQVLPQGHRALRQHPGGRQDHLRRLLPDGPVHRAGHDRAARTWGSRTRCGPSSCAPTPCGSSDWTDGGHRGDRRFGDDQRGGGPDRPTASTTPPSTPTTTTTRPPTPTPATSTRPWPSGPCSGPRSTAANGCWWEARSTGSSPTPPSTRWPCRAASTSTSAAATRRPRTCGPSSASWSPSGRSTATATPGWPSWTARASTAASSSRPSAWAWRRPWPTTPTPWWRRSEPSTGGSRTTGATPTGSASSPPP